MEYRQLGRSGLRVSVLGLGTMTFGGRGEFKAVGATDVREARRLIARALDAGVNLLDTADIYSGGASEEILGKALANRRDSVLLATKVRFATGDGPNDVGLSRYHIIKACEASLRRLNTDHIDVYQLHQWDGTVPLEETLSTLDRLVQQGKVRYIGCSNFAAWQLMKALGVAERGQLEKFVCHQLHYSPLSRDAELELIPLAIDQGLGVLVWGPLAGGLVSGKYRRGQDLPAESRFRQQWEQPPVYDWDRAYNIIECLVSVARCLGVSPAQVSLAYLASRAAVSSLLIGARTEEQLADNLAAADLELSPEHLTRINAVSNTELPYPYWHIAKTAGDRLSEAEKFIARGTHESYTGQTPA